MIKTSGMCNAQSLPCRLSWLLIEVNDDGQSEYFVIHSVEVIGDLNKAYMNRRIRFNQERRELSGLVRLASDDLKAVEAERKRLIDSLKLLSSDMDPQKPNLYCLVRQTTDDSKVQLITVSCKKLIYIESADIKRKHFLMQKGNSQIPVALLHVLDSEHRLHDEMELFNNLISQNYLNEENDRLVEDRGLEEAFLLIEYFESRNNLIYTIVRYSDTLFKNENLFPNVVVYIAADEMNTISQGIVLRKSFDRDELAKILCGVRETCDNLDFRLMNTLNMGDE